MAGVHLKPGSQSSTRCSAKSAESCPFTKDGALHFENKEAAEEYIAKQAAEENTSVKTLNKNNYENIHSEQYNKLLEEAPIYRKQAIVTMREAKPGEKLVTMLKGKTTAETTRTLKGGERIVTNPSGEEYAIEPEKFEKLYEATNDNKWRAKGRIKAVKNPTGKDITIMAPWSEEQHGDKDCYIAATASDPDNRYIIGGNEFNKTYAVE